MKKVDIDTWIQLLGMLSVLAGLVFVGLEMQQTQRNALVNQQQARTELITDMVLVDMQLVGDFGAIVEIATEWGSINSQQKALGEKRQNYLWQVLENNFFKTK